MIVRPQQHWLRRIFVWHGSVLSKISSRLLLNFLFSIAVIFMLPWYTHLGIKFTLAPFSILGVAIAIFLGLSEIGRDSVGAVTLIPEDETVTCPIMAWEKLTEARLEEVLTAYKADIPLGMIREENDFRISVAGAQEKTALLKIAMIL